MTQCQVIALPPQLTRIDATSRADHSYLEPADCCEYLAQYRVGRGDADDLRRLVLDFKCRPALAARSPACARRKRQAAAIIVSALRRSLTRGAVESATWVPVPPSRAIGDPDYDDRLRQALAAAFGGYDLDLRLLLTQTQSMAPDHNARIRSGADWLYRRLQVDVAALRIRPLRSRIVLFDDLLVSGKHYQCCRRRLREQLPHSPISGCFIARRLLPLRWRAAPRTQRADYAK